MSIEAMKTALEALDWRFSNADAAIEALRQAIEQAEKWDTSDMAYRPNGLTIDDYIQEYKKPWIGLTDEEIAEGVKQSWVTEQAFESAVWWAEAKLKEKNT